MKVGLLLVKNIVTSLVKSVLLSLGLTAVGSVIDIGIHKKFRPGTYGSETTILILSKEEWKDNKKIVKCLKDSNLLITYNTQKIENEINKHRGRFHDMILVTSGASSLVNMLAGNGVVIVSNEAVRVRDKKISAGNEALVIHNKSWWASVTRNFLDRFVCEW